MLLMIRARLISVAGLSLLLHALALTTLGTRAPGPFLSNIMELVLGALAIIAAYQAALRSGPFGRRTWLLMASAVSIWTVAQGIITYYDSILHASYFTRWPSDPLIFFWVVPLFMALFLVSMPGQKRLDPVQMFDFAQIMILAMAAYMAFLYMPSEWQPAGRWMAKRGWDTTNVRDAVLAGGLMARALFSHSKLVRRLFLRLAVFFLLYQLADLLYHYGEEVWNVTTGSAWDLLWSMPFVAVIVGASTWERPDETELSDTPMGHGSIRRLLFLSSAFLPLPVLLVAVRVQKETLALGASLVAASLVCSGARLVMTQRRRDQSDLLRSALYRIAEKASSCENTKELYAAIHGILGELMYARNFYIALHDEHSQTISFVYFQDEADTFQTTPVCFGRGLTEYVLRTGEPLLAGPQLFQEMLQRGEVETVGAPSVDWLGVPLKKADKAIGALVVQSYDERHRYGERDKEVLTFVAQHLASFIEQKRHEEALRQSEARYRSLFERNMAGVFRSTLDGRMLDCNQAFANMFGYTREELLALPTYALYPGGRAEREARMAEYRKIRQFTNYEICFQRKDGSLVWAIQNVSMVKDEHGHDISEGTVVDITERHKLEEQLLQSQKMEAIGQLAGGVAHDFNNLLTVIEGHTELLSQGFPSQDPRRTELEEIHKAASRATALTQQLLAFGRKQVLAPKALSLNTLVENMEKMLGRLLGERVAISTRLEKNLGTVKADPGQMEQVIMNLALNARDAMPNGGKLTLETANVELDEAYCREHVTAKPGSYVMLAVSDTGRGMDQSTKARIFEPFFTTKERGKGTGLGLSTVYGIVKQSEGYIWVYSEIDRGTTFKIYLPCVAEAATTPEPVRTFPVPGGGSETILLVEDEDAVRNLVCDALLARGYRVLPARDAEHALALARGHRDPIHLLLTDIVMPGKSGHELAGELLGSRPELKVLYLSGYTEAQLLFREGESNAAFLQKPFTLAALSRKIRELLDVDTD